jgi:hypothetical protein
LISVCKFKMTNENPTNFHILQEVKPFSGGFRPKKFVIIIQACNYMCIGKSFVRTIACIINFHSSDEVLEMFYKFVTEIYSSCHIVSQFD